MIHQALVTIHDEMDPVLVTVVAIGVEPVVYRDYRGMYDRPVTAISVRDFAEWVVIDSLKPEEVIRSEIIQENDGEMIRFVEVVYASH